METGVQKVCQGCNEGFSAHGGYLRHLRTTTQPACIALRKQEQQYPSSSSSSGDDNTDDEFEPQIPRPFEGDCLGNYDNADWDDYDEYQGGPDGDFEVEGTGGPGDPVGSPRSQGDEEEEWPGDGDEDDEDEDGDRDRSRGWEHPQRSPSPDTPQAGGDTEGAVESDASDRAAPQRAARHLRARTYVVQYPGDLAGSPIDKPLAPSGYKAFEARVDASGTNPYAPSVSRMDWEVAKWAEMRGPGSTALTEHLEIENLACLLGLPLKTSSDLNSIIDSKLSSGHPRFVRHEVVVAGEAFEFFHRDVIECIRALYGDAESAGIMVFTPERHYTDPDHTLHVYSDMHTGEWWWATQDICRKPSRRRHILLAYLPSTRLQHITSKVARYRAVVKLFHACMSIVLKPPRAAGIEGIELTSGDASVMRRGHPIFAVYVGDYPEQLLVTCCKNGTCPKCAIPCDEVGATADRRGVGRVVD
ncbi:hypothetical protein C8Q80DRAFT_1222483 [Daedaleopsis nitida]|nr:hypothetical protein C8Q80DRAFT_1222483 [Daedaleopsis nitida]